MSYDLGLLTITDDEAGDGFGGEYDHTITYNFSQFYRPTLGAGGLYSINRLTIAEALPRLDAAIAQLGTDAPDDRQETTTPGAAGRALARFAAFLRQHDPSERIYVY